MDRNKSKAVVQESPTLAHESISDLERRTSSSQTVKTPPTISQSSVFVDSLAPELDSPKKKRIDEEQVAQKVFSQPPTSITKGKQRARDQLPEKKEKEPWGPKMFGGILGTLLALVILVPVFIFLIILLDEDLNDVPTFEDDKDDTFFIRGFKRSFNGVMKVGVVVLLWLAIIVVVTLMLYFLYVQYGIIGVILGVVLLVLFVLLMAYLLNSFLEFLFPGITD